MSAKKQQPFQFDEFNKKVEETSVSQSQISQSDLERAEQTGFENGKHAALNSLEATKTDAVKRIADAVEAMQLKYKASVAETRTQDLEAIRSFLHEFFAKTAFENTVDEVFNSIQHIVSKSTNTIALTIKLHPVSFAREGEILGSQLQSGSFTNDISIEARESVKPGEFEISWQDGSLISKSEQTTKAVNDLLDRLKHLRPNGDAE